MIRNRRTSERVPTTELECKFYIGGTASDGFIVDYSKSGAKVGGLELFLLFADQKIGIQTKDVARQGRCRTVSRGPLGKFHVGVHFVDNDYEENLQSLLVNSFIEVNGLKRVCVPVSFEENAVQVQLLSGEEHTVNVEQIEQMTRSERLLELCDEDFLKKTLKSYGQSKSNNVFSDRTLILNHEFGPPILPHIDVKTDDIAETEEAEAAST